MPDYAATLHSFLRALTQAGVRVPVGTTAQVLTAVAAVGPLSLARVRATTRALTCTTPAEVALHDRIFAQFFGLRGMPGSTDTTEVPVPAVGQDDGARASAQPRGRASEVEVLKHADLETSPEAERALRLVDHLQLQPPRRRAALKHRAARGELDLARVIRANARTGELAQLPRRKLTVTTRPVTVVLDVSNSMRMWLPALLKFGRISVRSAKARCYVAGTRLTAVTGALSSASTPGALNSASRAGHMNAGCDLGLAELIRLAPDATGGTQLGVALQELLADRDRVVRSSVFVIVSDGWEAGDGQALRQALERISKLAATVIWVNPRAGRKGFVARVTGLRIAQEFVDYMVPATTVAQWEKVAELIAHRRVSGR